MNDVLFTFDSMPFQNAMKTMSSGINMMIKRVALIGAGFLSVRKALSFMPEVGKAFQIAGDIIGRNLLNPLRRQLIPLLQGMLDWVRDHRAMFVRWGSYLVNIFKIISNIVKGFISLLQNMWERLSSNIERIFGKTTKTMTEIVNVLLFKISAIASFIMIILEPVFDWIIDMVSILIQRIKWFFEGFMEGAGDIMEPLNDIIEMFGNLGELILGANRDVNTMTGLFRTLGAVAGGIVRVALEGIAQTIDTITFGLRALINGVKYAKAFVTGDKREMEKISREMDEQSKKFGQRTRKRVERSAETVSRVVDIGKRELGGQKSETTTNNNLNVAPITVQVTEGNAENAGRNYAKGLQDQLIEQDVASGGRR